MYLRLSIPLPNTTVPYIYIIYTLFKEHVSPICQFSSNPMIAKCISAYLTVLCLNDMSIISFFTSFLTKRTLFSKKNEHLCTFNPYTQTNIYPIVLFSSFSLQICQTRAWMLSTGFTLAYGAMFSKVWRVHRFTTKQKQDPKVKINVLFL